MMFATSCGDTATDFPDTATDDLDVTSGGCDGQLLYTSPGCEDVSVSCLSGAQDACGGVACSCSGVTIGIGCGFHTEPFASYGECPQEPGTEGPDGQ